jgi:hypothetical protein
MTVAIEQKSASSSIGRVHFLDNLRYLTAIMVIILHSTEAYASWIGDWYVSDPNKEPIFNIILVLCDSIVMPMFFFIAGFFAPSSYERYGMKGFIKRKLNRIMLPWLFGVLIIVPFMTYIFYLDYNFYYYEISSNIWKYRFTQFVEQPNFYDTWLYIITHSFYIGYSDPLYGNSHPLHFHQSYYWFLSELMVFFIIYAVFKKIIEKIAFRKIPDDLKKPYGRIRALFKSDKKSSERSIITAIVILFTVTTITYTFMSQTSLTRETWIRISPVLHFRPARLPIYVCFFICGIYAYNKKWFISGNGVKGTMVWVVLTIIFFNLWLRNIESGYTFSSIQSEQLQYNFFRIATTISFFAALLSITFNIWNKTSDRASILSQNSYNTYLVHLPIVVVMQLLMVPFAFVSTYAKFVIVVVSTIFMSLAIGQFIMRKSMRLYFQGLVGFLIVLILLFGGPTVSAPTAPPIIGP